MKTFSLVLATLFAVASFTACKKDDEVAKPVATIEGKWEGKYSFGNGPADKYFGFLVKDGGVFEEISSSGSKIGEGTWHFENQILMANYTRIAAPNTEYSIIGAFDKNQGEIAGTWGFEESNSDGGYIYMNKK